MTNIGSRPNITYTTHGMPTKQGYTDLLKYAVKHRSGGTESSAVHTYQDIQQATGLDLGMLNNPATIERLWDTSGNGTVDTAEMASGIAHLDANDGEYDGVIRDAGREIVEDLLGKSAKAEFDADTNIKGSTAKLKEYGLSDEMLEIIDDELATMDTTEIDEIGDNQRKSLLDKQIQTLHNNYGEQLLGVKIASGLQKMKLDVLG